MKSGIARKKVLLKIAIVKSGSFSFSMCHCIILRETFVPFVLDFAFLSVLFLDVSLPLSQWETFVPFVLDFAFLSVLFLDVSLPLSQ